MRTLKVPALLAMFALLLTATGCLTRRQEELLRRQPTNRVFQPAEVALPEGKGHSYQQWTASGTQDLMVLQLAPNRKLKRRYHSDHDVTLFVAGGSGIVQVETTRYPVSQGDAVLLPRYTAYGVIPHEQEGEMVCVLVFSPAYDPDDVHLLD